MILNITNIRAPVHYAVQGDCNFEVSDEPLVRDHSNRSYWAAISPGELIWCTCSYWEFLVFCTNHNMEIGPSWLANCLKKKSVYLLPGDEKIHFLFWYLFAYYFSFPPSSALSQESNTLSQCYVFVHLSCWMDRKMSRRKMLIWCIFWDKVNDNSYWFLNILFIVWTSNCSFGHHKLISLPSNVNNLVQGQENFCFATKRDFIPSMKKLANSLNSEQHIKILWQKRYSV